MGGECTLLRVTTSTWLLGPPSLKMRSSALGVSLVAPLLTTQDPLHAVIISQGKYRLGSRHGKRQHRTRAFPLRHCFLSADGHRWAQF